MDFTGSARLKCTLKWPMNFLIEALSVENDRGMLTSLAASQYLLFLQ